MREQRELKVGERLSDNAMSGRVLTITGLLANGVQAVDGRGHKRLYLRDRIFTDGKPRKYGLNVVE